MSTGGTPREGVLFFALGALVVVLGLLANELFVAFAFSPDGELDPSTRWKIRLGMTVLMCFGSVLILARKRLGRGARVVLSLYPNVAALVLGLGAACAGLLAIEAAFYSLDILRTRRSDWEVTAPVLKPGETTAASLTVRGTTVYDVTYTLGEDYARNIPGGDATDFTAKALFFFGGSFTFGQGVEDDETLPSVVAAAAPEWRVTNFGFPGHGPAQMLQRLEGGPLKDLESAVSAKLVYVFIPGHVRRAIGSMRLATAWGRDFPYYRVDADGGLARRGSFSEGRPVLSAVYRLLARERILAYFAVDFPLHIRSEHLELTTRIISESRDRFREQFTGAEFFVLLYPDQPTDEFHARELIPFLDAAGVHYLDYTDLFEGGSGFWLEHDQHPTMKAHARLGVQLSEDLELR